VSDFVAGSRKHGENPEITAATSYAVIIGH